MNAVIGFGIVALMMTLIAGIFIFPILRKALREEPRNSDPAQEVVRETRH